MRNFRILASLALGIAILAGAESLHGQDEGALPANPFRLLRNRDRDRLTTHGQSDRHRAPGSIGASATPARVLKGTRMAGHMGNKQLTVHNLVVLGTDPARNLLLVKGAVPGGRNGLLLIRKSTGRK